MFFILGASGSGKSSIMRHFQDHHIQFFDFDDIGVPENADTLWRQQATEQWLQKIIADGNQNNTCLTGQLVLGEIIACPSFSKLSSVHVCFLDCDDAIRINRLKQRGSAHPSQDSLNWASWLRMHHQDPQWTPHVITHTHALEFDRWKNSQDWASFADINIINTSYFCVDEVADAINEWLSQYQDQTGIYFQHAKHADLKDIINLIKQDTLAQQRESLSESLADDYELAFEKITHDCNAILLTCKDSQTLIGVLQLNFIPNLTYQGGTRAQIEGVRIKADYRGHGIGTKMMNKAIELAKQRHCCLVQLTTDKLRPEALAFYEKLGFKNSHHGLKLKLM